MIIFRNESSQTEAMNSPSDPQRILSIEKVAFQEEAVKGIHPRDPLVKNTRGHGLSAFVHTYETDLLQIQAKDKRQSLDEKKKIPDCRCRDEAIALR
ncbi:hypothetical protein [Brevibacillus thermoruber]|uniref:hypothetical protein n=1 Tax=Brevibacillus thermoruber TaxID=33942 RepID=UPI00048CB23D|nr:hypothetical protein [Brevibacillus thermoruber]